MSNFKDNPRYNVVSLRINDDENAELNEIRRRTRKCISDIMREALELYSQQVRGAQKQRPY